MFNIMDPVFPIWRAEGSIWLVHSYIFRLISHICRMCASIQNATHELSYPTIQTCDTDPMIISFSITHQLWIYTIKPNVFTDILLAFFIMANLTALSLLFMVKISSILYYRIVVHVQYLINIYHDCVCLK